MFLQEKFVVKHFQALKEKPPRLGKEDSLICQPSVTVEGVGPPLLHLSITLLTRKDFASQAAPSFLRTKAVRRRRNERVNDLERPPPTQCVKKCDGEEGKGG